MESNPSTCVFCETDGGRVVFSHRLFRVVWADEPLYPGFLRLIWQAHVREFSELSDDDQSICMRMVCRMERFVLEVLKADKANLATLGNVTPHLHWHVIPRFVDDAHFPAPVWGTVLEGRGMCEKQKQIEAQKQSLISQLSAWLGQEAV